MPDAFTVQIAAIAIALLIGLAVNLACVRHT